MGGGDSEPTTAQVPVRPALAILTGHRLLVLSDEGWAAHALPDVGEVVIGREPSADVRLLGYQPFERLRESLSAADVHLVSMGNEMVGIVHPCKVYGAMAVGRPVLLLGPRRSHIGVILSTHDVGWQVDHGDVDALVRTIRAILGAEAGALERKGLRAQQVVRDEFSRALLRERFCDVLEGRNIPTLY